MKNIVFIAKSLDGFIAGPNNELDWLDSVPIPEGTDTGYEATMEEIDALVMGRNTFETVLGFDVPWPYQKKVFVLSHGLDRVPEALEGKVEILSGELEQVLKVIHDKGYQFLYIDGGKTIQAFLKSDLIDELRITTIPILLGKGLPLFDHLEDRQRFEHLETKVVANQLVFSSYRRKR